MVNEIHSLCYNIDVYIDTETAQAAMEQRVLPYSLIDASNMGKIHDS